VVSRGPGANLPSRATVCWPVTRLDFTSVRQGDIWISHFVDASRRGVVAEAFWARFSGEGWTEDALRAAEVGIWPDKGETSSFLLGAAWRLTEGRRRLAVPAFYRDQVAEALGAPFDLVRWEFATDPAATSADARFPGFERARSCVPIRPSSTDWQRNHASEAGVFEVPTFGDLGRMMAALLGDDSADLSLFGVGSASSEPLVARLNTWQRPSLDEVLEGDDILVHVTLSTDEFLFCDSLFVASRWDHRQHLARVTGEVERGIEAYEASAPRLSTVDEFVAALRASAGA
jgi:hypothetical protein